MLASKEGHGGDRLAIAGLRPACGITDGLDGDIHHEKTARIMDKDNRSHEIDTAGARIVPMVS